MTNTPIQQLPFKTAPKQETRLIGDEEIGVLEFPVYNDLTVTESAFIQASAASKSAFQFTAKAALKIAKEQKVKPLEAHTFVTKLLAAAMGAANVEMNEKEQDWSVRYVRELEETAMKVLEVSVMQQQTLVTCMIRHRLPGMESWENAQTAQLPSSLVAEIYAFAQLEQNRGVPVEVTEQAEELVEMLGKSRTEATKTPEELTGEKSSGNAESSSPEAPSSPSTDSETSKPDTSSNA